jgi:alkaline phosphatase D
MLNLNELPQAVRYEGGVSRRLFLAYSAALASLPGLAHRSMASSPKIAFSAYPFAVGVASGDPESTSVVIWTRLAPKPLEPNGGMPPEAIEVRWEVADDEAFKSVVRSGSAIATPQLGHSIHVEVEGLKPDRWYFYRFQVGDAISPIGRTRTTPPRDASPDKLRFAFASCQHYEHGLFTAYEHMAKDDLDLVFHLGDYTYERHAKEGSIRRHVGAKPESLAEFRVRHSQYRADPLLHQMHARCPWVVTWDDHEVENNYANDVSARPLVDAAEMLQIRANAYQAYYEAMPLRKRSVPQGPDMMLYRTINFGRLAAFQVLDTRQFRTDQANGDGRKELNEAARNPANTILGAQQRGWLQASLLRSEATWNVLAQQVLMAMIDFDPGEPKLYGMDSWPGYTYERMKLMEFLANRKVPNPVVLTGDSHKNWVNELRIDDRENKTPIVAIEFGGTSISSTGDDGKPLDEKGIQSNNPFVRFLNRQRGYVRVTATPKEWRSDYVVVEYVSKPGAPAINKASFVIEAGKAAVNPA